MEYISKQNNYLTNDLITSTMLCIIKKLKNGIYDIELRNILEEQEKNEPDFSKMTEKNVMQAFIPALGKRLGELTERELKYLAEIHEQRAKLKRSMALLLRNMASTNERPPYLS